METVMKCECCGATMLADFANNVWCPNNECLLHDQCYSHDFYEGRAQAREEKRKPQQKSGCVRGG